MALFLKLDIHKYSNVYVTKAYFSLDETGHQLFRKAYYSTRFHPASVGIS